MILKAIGLKNIDKIAFNNFIETNKKTFTNKELQSLSTCFMSNNAGIDSAANRAHCFLKFNINIVTEENQKIAMEIFQSSVQSFIKTQLTDKAFWTNSRENIMHFYFISNNITMDDLKDVMVQDYESAAPKKINLKALYERSVREEQEEIKDDMKEGIPKNTPEEDKPLAQR